MRLADIDELCEVPQDGAREALRPGDLAGLVIVHSDEGWGDGFEPAEARILDVEGPGCYMGEFADGSRIRFNERNVAAVGHSLGGVFDWVKKAFKGIVPPTPGMLPALPPEPKQSQLPAQVPPAAPRAVTPSFLDWFKPKPTLPAVRPEGGPAAPAKPKKPGIFDWLKPKPYAGPTGVVVPPETIIAPAAHGASP